MFGYVTIDKPELKIKDYNKYKAYYCGLCQSLKQQYGVTGQMTLTYDMTFAIILLTSLYESDTELTKHRCVVHPVKKQEMLQNEITEYAASMNVILAYYHFEDDWKDEKSIAGFTGMKVLQHKVRSIEAQYQRQCKKIKASLLELKECEEKQITDIDRVSGCFGRLMEELFIWKEDQWEPGLRRLGFFLGKFIYIMDAYDDVSKDIETGSYNPLKERYGEASYEESCSQMLTMMLAECSNEFEKLPCLWDTDILRNILYAGAWTKYNQIQRETKERKE
ncbi:MAG: DUF5685 family protein [Lachnospiraceae bacterium]